MRVNEALWLERLCAISVRSARRSLLAVHTQLCRRHLPLYLFGIKTFLRFSGLPCRVVVSNDGSLSRTDEQVLRSEIPGVEVMASRDTCEYERMLVRHPACRRFLRSHRFARKLFTPFLVPSVTHVILLDADVLWLRRPHEILRWASSVRPVDSLFNVDPSDRSVSMRPHEWKAAGLRRVPHFNAGLLCLPRHLLDLAIVERVLQALEQRDDRSGIWIEEQTVWAGLVGRGCWKRLPPCYHVVSKETAGNARDLNQFTTIHYTGAKEKLMGEGVRFLVESGRL